MPTHVLEEIPGFLPILGGLLQSYPQQLEVTDKTLSDLGLPGLMYLLRRVKIVSRCGCTIPGCATVDVVGGNNLNGKPRIYHRVGSKDGSSEFVQVDISGDGEISSLEIIGCADLVATLVAADIPVRQSTGRQ